MGEEKLMSPISFGASSRERVETALRLCFTLSVALSPLGPVVHYSLWGVCFVLAAYDIGVNKAPLMPRPLPESGKPIFALFAALALWVAFAGLFSFDTVVSYGRNVTPFLEVSFGMWLAVRALGDERSRDRFAGVFVGFSSLIVVCNVLRYVGLIPDFPNHSLLQNNSAGMLGMFLFPVVCCFALWERGSSFLKKVLLLVVSVSLTVVSCSSGAWASAFCGGLVVLFYSARFRKLTARVSLTALCVFLCCYAAMNAATGGAMLKRVAVEVDQLSAINDSLKFTNHRSRIWNVTWRIAKEHPLLGNGGQLFENAYRAEVEKELAARRAAVKRKASADPAVGVKAQNARPPAANKALIPRPAPASKAPAAQFSTAGKAPNVQTQPVVSSPAVPPLEAGSLPKKQPPAAKKSVPAGRAAVKKNVKKPIRRTEEIFTHPHSTYLYLLYAGGVPAFVLFLAAMGVCLCRMIRLSAREKDAAFPWAVVSLALLVEILVYGTNGDVFQGRRDISVMLWCFFGLMAALPDPEEADDAAKRSGNPQGGCQ